MSKIKIKTERDGYRCCKCGHEWVPRHNKAPEVCPKCKRRSWDDGKDCYE